MRESQVGAELATKFGHLVIEAEGFRHERHARLVEELLGRAPGVLHSAVAFGASRIYVEYDPQRTTADAIHAVVETAGLRLAGEKTETLTLPLRSRGDARHERRQWSDDHGHEYKGIFGAKAELVSSIACGVLTVAGWAAPTLGAAAIETRLIFVAA